MRAAITSLPPVYPELSAAAGWSTATQAALAAGPVLSFAVFSGTAPMLARKLGEERVLGLALVLLVAGGGGRAAAPRGPPVPPPGVGGGRRRGGGVPPPDP